MKIRSHAFSVAWKALLSIGAFTGIILQCGFFTPEPRFAALRYYTLVSNALVAFYFLFATVWAFRKKPTPYPVFKGTVMMCITVTGLVFHTMLSESGFGTGDIGQALASQLLHTFTPIATVLDFLLFDEKGMISLHTPLLWTILPDVYFVLATVYGFTSGDTFHGSARFPYFFMDYDQLGVLGVLCYIIALNIFFIALGYFFVLCDRLMNRMKDKYKLTEE